MIDDNEFLENQNELYAFSNHETRLINTLNRRIQELEAALREIAEHPHTNPESMQWHPEIHHLEGHRCAAEIARKALEK